MQTQQISPLTIPNALVLGRPRPAMPLILKAAVKPVSPLVALAAERGFPSELFGFTPADAEYWKEPGMPWMGAFPRTVAELEAYKVQPNGKQYHAELGKDDNRMAPRFLGGSLLRVVPVTCKRDIIQGVYFWQWEQDGGVYGNMGRLQHIERGRLRMTHDVDGRE